MALVPDRPQTTPPQFLCRLVDRYDAGVLDLPARRPLRVRLAVAEGEAWDAVLEDGAARLEAPGGGRPHALLRADAATWRRVGEDLRGGMGAFRGGRLRVRHDLALGVGFLAATSDDDRPGRLRLRRVRTQLGTLAALEAGQGPPLVLLHGLGGTKVSFLPTIAALADRHRLVALDLPGFGASDKPLGPYDAPFIARRIVAALDALGLDRTHLLGHSLGGRVALEVAFEHPQRIDRLVLMTPSLAWLRSRPWARWLRLVRPELGLIQPAPRAIVDRITRRLVPGAHRDGWAAAAVDEFLHGYLTPRGRAAFYAAARSVYLEEPERFWTRLRTLGPDSLFVWGRRDALVPHGFVRHVRDAVPAAQHLELDCGHIPQLEAPAEVHRAIGGFLRGRPAAG